MKNLENKRRMFNNILIIMISLLCGLIYLYLLVNRERPFTSDDAETTIHYYNYFRRGISFPIEIKLRFLSFFNILSYLTFKIGGCSVFATQLIFAEKFVICIFLSLVLIVYSPYNKKVAWSCVPLFIVLTCFLSVQEPGIVSSQFHTDPLICFLIFLIFYEHYRNKNTITYKTFLIIISVLTVLQIDFLMIPIFFIPFVVYLVYEFFDENQKIKIWKIIFCCFIAFSLGLFILNVLENLNIIAPVAFEGYGAKKISTVSEVGSNISVLVEGLQDMFNANIAGKSMISLSIIVPLLKVLLVLIGFCLMVRYLFKPEKTVEFYCAVSSISTILIFICSGKHIIYEIRYVSCLLFLVPLILCRTISKKVTLSLEKKMVVKLKKTLVWIVLCTLLLGASQLKIYKTNNMEEFENLAKVLDEEGLEYGISSFWSANVMDVVSNFRQNVQAVKLDSNNALETELDEWDFYEDKSNYFNYIIIDKDLTQYQVEDYGINKDNIIEVYGEPQRTAEVDGRWVYIYDYDVRNIPQKESSNSVIWKYSGNENGKLKKGGYASFSYYDFEIGEYVIVINGKNLSKKVKLQIDGNDAELLDANETALKFLVKIEECSDEKMVKIINNSDSKIEVRNAMIETKREALDVKFDNGVISKNNLRVVDENGIQSDWITVTPQNYRIVIYGQNVDKLEVELQNSNDELVLYEKSKNRVVYELSVAEKEEIGVLLKSLSTAEVTVTNISIEVEENKDKQEYDWGQLQYNKNVKIKSDYAEIRKQGLQYGPYCDLEAGLYKIEIRGKNLKNASVSCTADGGKKVIDIKNRIDEQEKITYYISISCEERNVEFLLQNDGGNTIYLEKYQIEKIPLQMSDNKNNLCYDAEYLFYDGNVSVDKDSVCLKNSTVQFGPYCSLERGRYLVQIKGENLKEVTVSSTYQYGKKQIDIEDLEQSEDKISYIIDVSNNIENVEFLLQNETNEDVVLNSYNITRL